MKKLIIIGAGGAGRDTLWCAERFNAARPAEAISLLGFADDTAELAGQDILGLRVLGSLDAVIQQYGGQDVYFHCAVGSNPGRKKVSERFEAAGFRALSVIDPSAIIAPSATVGEGCFVGVNAVITPRAVVGRHVIINVAAMVGHDVQVGDYAQICPGAKLTGFVKIGALAFIGANAIVAPGISVGARSILGANSAGVRDIPEGVSAIGMPPKIVAPGYPA